MMERPSLVTRIVVAKTVGFLVGLIDFVATPIYMPDADPLIRWGFLFWYTTLGLIIALLGVVTRHPVLGVPMPWWLRAPLMGAWMNFVLTLFLYDWIGRFTVAVFGPDGLLASPFWFVAEGAVVGLLIGWLATRVGGEGPAVVGR